ncbi:pyroglutamyl-peptidase 1-like [Tropilaelaps mercedesae]|uniref:Pyroglutamyl-peptidase 1-like n=1 Tax=Tropilaelaps mercedesae TaxID=418985 RepID=A0A1V9X1Z4_9ACAR|nr:pyroglutamyl-peptidase 1-like [Tropilaelaps mercedesae]
MTPTNGSCASQSLPVVLITGYGLFRDFSTNSSKEVVEQLGKVGIENIDLRTEILPVEYNQVKRRSQELFEKHQPILTVHCGMHSKAHAVVLEQKARNSGYDAADVQGQLPENNCCMSCASPEFLTTSLDLEAIAAQIGKGISMPVYISRDAGNYLCEFIYYCSLSRCRRTLFVHFPHLSSEFTLEGLANTLKRIVVIAVAQCIRHSENNQ